MNSRINKNNNSLDYYITIYSNQYYELTGLVYLYCILEITKVYYYNWNVVELFGKSNNNSFIKKCLNTITLELLNVPLLF